MYKHDFIEWLKKRDTKEERKEALGVFGMALLVVGLWAIGTFIMCIGVPV
jgi:hypothetical protein